MDVCCDITGERREVPANRDGSPRLPRGWKRIGPQTLSPAALADQFAARTITLPVASIALEGDDDPKEGWRLFRAALRPNLQAVAQFCNFAILEFAKRDSAPLTRDGQGLPRLPKIESDDRNRWWREVYAEGRARWPELDSQSLCSLRGAIWSDYSHARFDLRIRGKAHRAGYKVGYPLPIPKKDVRVWQDSGNKWIYLGFRLAGQRFTVRLSGDRRYLRHRTSLEQAIANPDLLGEIAISERLIWGDNAGCNTSTTKVGNGRAHRAQKQILVRTTVRCPKHRKPVDPETRLVCKTSPDRLLTAFVGDAERPWDLNEDRARRVIAAYRQRLHRLAQDLKFERRRPKPEGDGLAAARARLCDNHRRWLDDWVHKVSRMVVNFAARHRCAALHLDGTEGRWPVPIPWFKLLSQIEYKCRDFGITFSLVGFSDSDDAE